VELNQQIFKAPSIPKIGSKTISSSVIRGAVKPQIKLNRSVFRFVKPVQKSIDPQKISSILPEKNVSVESTLGETNRILVEIQKQLALDFGYRITEEKKALAAERKRIGAQKVSEKESKIEKDGRSFLGKTFDKVVAPFKSIFQKLIDFFSIILTGILLNNAFKWLSKKENREKLKKFFDFIKEYWQELLIIFAAYKLARLVAKVFGVARNIKKVLSGLGALIRRLKGQGKPPTGSGGDPCKPLLQCMGNPAFSSAFAASSIAAFLANQQIRDYIADVAQGSYFPGAQPALPLVPQNPLTLPTPQQPLVPSPILDPFTGKPIILPTGKPDKIEEIVTSPTPEQLRQQRRKEDIEKFRKQFTPGGYSVQNIQNAQERAKPPNGISKADWLKIVGDIASVTAAAGAVLIPADGPVLDSIAIANLVARGIVSRQTVLQIAKRSGSQAAVKILERNLSPQPVVARSMGGTISELPKKKCTACSLGFSEGGTISGLSKGGTVGGRGNGLVDTIPAMLAAGEEVIRTSSAMLFRPLLKDINDNAGRLWQAFSGATQKQNMNNVIQSELNMMFSKLIIQFKELIEEEIKRIRSDKNKDRTPPGGGGKRPKYQASVPKINIPQSVTSQNSSNLQQPSTIINQQAPQINNTNVTNTVLQPNLNVSQPQVVVLPIPIKNLQRPTQQPKVSVINLPPKTVNLGPKPGSIKTPSSGEATSVPSIPPIDSSNPYIAYTRNALGIVM
jgi:hypothetical protein